MYLNPLPYTRPTHSNDHVVGPKPRWVLTNQPKELQLFSIATTHYHLL